MFVDGDCMRMCMWTMRQHLMTRVTERGAEEEKKRKINVSVCVWLQKYANTHQSQNNNESKRKRKRKKHEWKKDNVKKDKWFTGSRSMYWPQFHRRTKHIATENPPNWIDSLKCLYVSFDEQNYYLFLCISLTYIFFLCAFVECINFFACVFAWDRIYISLAQAE